GGRLQRELRHQLDCRKPREGAPRELGMRNHETRMVEREISPQEVDIELPGPVTNVANATRRSLESVGEGEEFERISAGPHEERSVQKVRLRGADRGRLKQARDARLRVELGAEHLD